MGLEERQQTKMNCDIDFARINGFRHINIKKPLLHKLPGHGPSWSRNLFKIFIFHPYGKTSVAKWIS